VQKAVNFVVFQAVWFAAVGCAAEGALWVGPAAGLAFVVLHLWMTPASERVGEARLVIGFTLLGALLDSGLKALGLTAYPTSGAAWPEAVDWLVPGWILALWAGFACLPRFSLGWLTGRFALAALFGAIGGPLSYWGGARMGAVALADEPFRTVVALSLEYAVVTPFLLVVSARVTNTRQASTVA
jgi:hypothetical protein